MTLGETLRMHTREQWRDWLQRNAGVKREVWLEHSKKGAANSSLDYEVTLREAICFGWIDGMIRGGGPDHYYGRWTPRRPRSHWTAANLERARQLYAEGLMTEAGIAALPPGTIPSPGSRGTPSR